jgi:hypothetical protein
MCSCTLGGELWVVWYMRYEFEGYTPSLFPNAGDKLGEVSIYLDLEKGWLKYIVGSEEPLCGEWLGEYGRHQRMCHSLHSTSHSIFLP